MTRKGLLSLAVCVLVCAAAWGKARTVVLKKGGHVTGEVTETPDGYRVKTAYGVLEYTKDQVLSVSDALTPRQEYERRRAEIAPGKAEDHFRLAEWAYGAELLKFAKKELEEALKLDKDHETAARLLDVVNAKLHSAATPGDGNSTGQPTKTVSSDVKYALSEENIYRVRLEELRPRERGISIKFRNKVLDRFIESDWGDEAFKDTKAVQGFHRMSHVQKALLIRDAVEDEGAGLKDDILVRSDPKFMMDFRTQVWPLVAGRCASKSCHGGPIGKGGFKLLKTATRPKAVGYANFVLMDGFVGKKGGRMIDRNTPSRSLLLDYGLTPKTRVSDETEPSHPKVKGFRPMFLRTRDIGYRRIAAWVAQLRGPQHPDYRLQYVPPPGVKLDFGVADIDLTKPVAPLDKEKWPSTWPANGGSK